MMVITVGDVDRYIRTAGFPAKKADLLAAALKAGATEEVITVLEQLPDDAGYRTRAELDKALNDFIQTQRQTGPR